MHTLRTMQYFQFTYLNLQYVHFQPHLRNKQIVINMSILNNKGTIIKPLSILYQAYWSFIDYCMPMQL